MKRNENIGIAVIGDVLDINCWSNTPYYFYKTGNAKGLFTEPWQLSMNAFNLDRKLWNLKQFLTGKGIGGYQYSTSFLDKAEKQIPKNYFSSRVISFNQTFPRAKNVKKHRGEIYYYIDTTLHELFLEPSYGISIPDLVKEKAISIERENYLLADGIVSMGSWVKDSLINYYNIPKNKIFSILPGANIENYSDYRFHKFKPGAGITRELILGFVGKDWKRKGLPILLDVLDLLVLKGYKVKIKAIGYCPQELLNHSGLEFTGFVNKQFQSEEFLNIISSCDIGCLFSESEALGISTLEFLHAGVPVTGFYHQGLKDTLLDGASFKFNLGSSASEISQVIENYINNGDLQYQMFMKAKEYSKYVTWDRCIEEWRKILI